MLKPLFTYQQLEEAKIKNRKIKMCHKILREILFNCMFIWVLFTVSYSNRNENSFNYQNILQRTFSSYETVSFISESFSPQS